MSDMGKLVGKRMAAMGRYFHSACGLPVNRIGRPQPPCAVPAQPCLEKLVAVSLLAISWASHESSETTDPYLTGLDSRLFHYWVGIVG